MKTRFLLMSCLSLIVGSVFLAPEMVHIGLDMSLAADLSKVLLLAGIVAAIMTIDAEAREVEMREKL